MPRHPPCALISLTYSRIMSCFSTEELFEIVFYPLNFFNWISLISSLLFRYSIFKEHLSLLDIWSPWVLFGGDEENRTPDPLLARQVLSQLSYTPIVYRVLPSYALFEDSFLSEEILKIKQCTSIARLRILLAAFFFKCLPHFFSNSFTRSLTP